MGKFRRLIKTQVTISHANRYLSNVRDWNTPDGRTESWLYDKSLENNGKYSIESFQYSSSTHRNISGEMAANNFERRESPLKIPLGKFAISFIRRFLPLNQWWIQRDNPQSLDFIRLQRTLWSAADNPRRATVTATWSHSIAPHCSLWTWKLKQICKVPQTRHSWANDVKINSQEWFWEHLPWGTWNWQWIQEAGRFSRVKHHNLRRKHKYAKFHSQTRWKCRPYSRKDSEAAILCCSRPQS